MQSKTAVLGKFLPSLREIDKGYTASAWSATHKRSCTNALAVGCQVCASAKPWCRVKLHFALWLVQVTERKGNLPFLSDNFLLFLCKQKGPKASYPARRVGGADNCGRRSGKRPSMHRDYQVKFSRSHNSSSAVRGH
jgi:hypothetical protein